MSQRSNDKMVTTCGEQDVIASYVGCVCVVLACISPKLSGP